MTDFVFLGGRIANKLNQRNAKILGYDATEQLIWENRIQPPGGRYETVAASFRTLCEYSERLRK